MRFKKNEKLILLFFIILGISYSFVLIYFDSILPRPPVGQEAFRTLGQREIVDINQTKTFNLLSDINNYPFIIPEYVSSVEVINQTNNETYAIIKVHMLGLTDEFIIKHYVIPPQKQTFEIMNKDAQGTKIIQTFDVLKATAVNPGTKNNEDSTMIFTSTELHVKGILKVVANINPYTYQNTIASVIDSIISTAENYESDSGKKIDGVYLEILGRHVDPAGLDHYLPLLESNKITLEEIKELLMDSVEKKLSSEADNIITISEISDETKEILDVLYQDILYREVDIQGLQYYGSLLENKKITVEEIEKKLLESEEKKYAVEPSKRKSIYELKDETRHLVNDVYKEFLFRSVDKYGLEHFGNLLEAEKITPEEFREIMLESEEHKMLMRNVHDRAENRPP